MDVERDIRHVVKVLTCDQPHNLTDLTVGIVIVRGQSSSLSFLTAEVLYSSLRFRRQSADHSSTRIEEFQNRRPVGGYLNNYAVAALGVLQLQRH